ncbi:hypothetical protein [Ruminococcus sp.]|uniref:hypothetical protein n=1 Tax=Ruminococcus sp. TaxID=41978 RepID=UPI0025EDB25F|nr:hypothetical protein [Ruminococcus sp.]
MKKRMLKTVAASLSILSIATATIVPASAANDNIQPRGNYYVYGDVDNDGQIDIQDANIVLSAVSKFTSLTGDENLPTSYAIARPSVYFPNIDNPVPQTADVNGDRFINQADAEDILSYYAKKAAGVLDQYNGRCGTPFYVG